ncbi:MAG: hypothetical protein HND48_05410 [Chloroflexi bacterium]|nr:hypothetical protein [Chloroflexota bacterium]
MTRIAVLSDIHGICPPFARSCAISRSFTVDHVVVAGDVINWGPFNREVIEVVLDQRWTVIEATTNTTCSTMTPTVSPNTGVPLRCRSGFTARWSRM